MNIPSSHWIIPRQHQCCSPGASFLLHLSVVPHFPDRWKDLHIQHQHRTGKRFLRPKTRHIQVPDRWNHWPHLLAVQRHENDFWLSFWRNLYSQTLKDILLLVLCGGERPPWHVLFRPSCPEWNKGREMGLNKVPWMLTKAEWLQRLEDSKKTIKMLKAVHHCFCQMSMWDDGLEENDFSIWPRLISRFDTCLMLLGMEK